MHRVLTGSLRVETLTVAIADLPKHLQGKKLVQLSDFHYEGWGLSEKLLAQAIAVSNAADPDLIVLTGDYVTKDPAPVRELIIRLKHLQSRAGIYAILGNHDIKLPQAKAEIIAALNTIDIQVLWNEVAYPFGPDLALVGMAEWWSGQFHTSVLMSIDENTPRIVLSHNPDTAIYFKGLRVDLQLSGHTHGGQIVLPKIGPLPSYLKSIRRRIPKPLRPWIPYMSNCYRVVEHWQWSQGFHQVGSNQLYVNRGLGTYLPGRLFCPPEVTIITLVRKKNEQT